MDNKDKCNSCNKIAIAWIGGKALCARCWNIMKIKNNPKVDIYRKIKTRALRKELTCDWCGDVGSKCYEDRIVCVRCYMYAIETDKEEAEAI